MADLLPVEVDPDAARAVLDLVPLWFHTFSLNRSEDLYTPASPATIAIGFRPSPRSSAA